MTITETIKAPAARDYTTIVPYAIFMAALLLGMATGMLDSYMFVDPATARDACGLFGAIALGSAAYMIERRAGAGTRRLTPVGFVFTVAMSAFGMALGIGFANAATMERDDHEIRADEYRDLADMLAGKPYAARLIASARVDGIVTNGEYTRFRSDLIAIDDAKARARVLGN